MAGDGWIQGDAELVLYESELAGVRRMTTARTVWLFDETSMAFMRVPRSESPAHPSKPYAGAWEPFLSVWANRLPDGWTYVRVVQPSRTTETWVPPAGSDSAVRSSGGG